MRVLVTWGSKRGGTEGIARMLGDALRADGLVVDTLPPSEAAKVTDRADAVVVGGALYANRWDRAARRFVNRQQERLRRVPVWFFSSGPLDDFADRQPIPPPPQVEALMQRVGAQGHVTFGGRLTPDARGFPASAMARTRSGDWRNPRRIRAWADDIAGALPTARPGVVVAQPARSAQRLLAHGLVGWALCAAASAVALATASLATAILVHALAALVFFTWVARSYFRVHGVREPLQVALAFTGIVVGLDVAAALVALGPHVLARIAGSVGTWLAFAIVFIVTWGTGEVMSMLPLPTPSRAP